MADKCSIMIDARSGILVTCVPNSLTGGVTLRVDNQDGGKIAVSEGEGVMAALDKADAVELGKWLLDLDAVLEWVKNECPRTEDLAADEYRKGYQDSLYFVKMALKGGGE